MTVNIRRSSYKDVKIVKDMVFSILDEYNVERDPDGSDQDIMKFGIENNGQHDFVLEINGCIIGCVILTDVKSGRVKLSKLFLNSSYRGLGYGKLLLDYVIKTAIRNGKVEIFLCTRDLYKEAVSLYERCGWTRKETDRIDGPDVVYFKRLEKCRPIVLIHGLYGNLSNAKIIKEFNGRTVFHPDLIGYGKYVNKHMKSNTIDRQARHIASLLSNSTNSKVHVVGHSLGGAVAVRLTSLFPELVASLTSIEGNLSIKDAFWSEKLSVMEVNEISDLTHSYASNIEKWISSASVTCNVWNIELATYWLSNQPASTLKYQSRAVVEETKKTRYLEDLYDVIDSIPVYLIAGEKSLKSWSIPDKLKSIATSLHVIPNRGHLMMLESPNEFVKSILDNYED